MDELHGLLADNIRRYRAYFGLSQAELGRRAGVSPGFIAEIEIGRKLPSLEKLAAIAGVLNLRPFRLLMGAQDVTDAMGPQAVYETAEKLKKRLTSSIDEFVRAADPDRPQPPQEFYDAKGRRLRGR